MKQKTITKQQLIHENDELRLQIDQLKAAQQHNIEIEKALSRRDKILEATGYLADHILKTGNLDQGLQKGLQCLGDSTGVSRVYIFQNSTDIDGLLLMSQSYEWASPNTNSLIDNPTLQNVPYATDTRRAKMKDLLSKGNVYSGQTPFFSEEERSSLESQSILAIAVFPIFVENKWWGFIGFDDCETPRIWSPAEIGALKIAAGTIGSAIQREKAQKALLREQFNLEVKVRERTSLLTNVNLQLQQEIEEKKEIETRLQKNKEWLDLALSASNTGLWDWDVKTGKVVANEWYYSMLGLNPDMDPHSFKFFESLLHPNDRDKTIRSINRHIEKNRSGYELEFRLRTKTGNWIWVLDKGKVVERDAIGNPLRVVGTHSNITIRREIEEALRKSEERFQLALEAANDGIWDWNVTTGKVFANPSYYTMLGFSPELNPSSFDEFETWIHPEERERIVSTIQSSIRSKKGRYELEFRMGSAIEGWHWILDKAKVVERDAAGNPLRVVGTHSNITHRKKTEEILNKRDHDLKINAQKLEDVNTALKVLLKNNEDDKKRLEDTILVNVKELIIPYIERLKNSTINGRQLSFVEILETNLNNIISPFLKNISLNYSTLTPREIQVANLVKEGKTTKEIAQAFSISTDAVDFHRKTLRTKLGLRNKKVNLRSYLLSLT